MDDNKLICPGNCVDILVLISCTTCILDAMEKNKKKKSYLGNPVLVVGNRTYCTWDVVEDAKSPARDSIFPGRRCEIFSLSPQATSRPRSRCFETAYTGGDNVNKGTGDVFERGDRYRRPVV